MAAIGEFVHWVGLPIIFKSKQNQGFVLDRNTTEGGKNTVIWTISSGPENKVFSVDADGRIHMYDKPNWVLDAGPTNAAAIDLKTVDISKDSNIANHNRVKWKLHPDGKIESLAYPGKILDIHGAKMEKGTKVILYKDNGSAWQKWIPALIDKAADNTQFKTMYDSATKKSSLTLSEYARAWNAPFILELSIDGYDTCLETPYESFCACGNKKYDVIFCTLSIIVVILALILLYLYVKRSCNKIDKTSTDTVYDDDELE